MEVVGHQKANDFHLISHKAEFGVGLLDQTEEGTYVCLMKMRLEITKLDNWLLLLINLKPLHVVALQKMPT